MEDSFVIPMYIHFIRRENVYLKSQLKVEESMQEKHLNTVIWNFLFSHILYFPRYEWQCNLCRILLQNTFPWEKLFQLCKYRIISSFFSKSNNQWLLHLSAGSIMKNESELINLLKTKDKSFFLFSSSTNLRHLLPSTRYSSPPITSQVNIRPLLPRLHLQLRRFRRSTSRLWSDARLKVNSKQPTDG